jgi:predicted nucleotidyltransferase component of viral defense system
MKWIENEIYLKLKQESQKYGIHITQVQLLLAQERFLARLMSITDGKSYIWKGGSLLLRKYSSLEQPRFTIDIDLLVKGLEIKQTKSIFLKAITIDLKDGFKFYDISKSKMLRETPYGGERFEIKWSFFGRANPQLLRIDVCTGDDVSEDTININNIFILKDDMELSIKVYPAEFIFAEKLETVMRFGTGNTRLKDFIDLWQLSKYIKDEDKLLNAVERCFKNRKAKLNLNNFSNIIFNTEFAALLETQRLRRYNELKVPSLSDMIKDIYDFVLKNIFNKQ